MTRGTTRMGALSCTAPWLAGALFGCGAAAPAAQREPPAQAHVERGQQARAGVQPLAAQAAPVLAKQPVASAPWPGWVEPYRSAVEAIESDAAVITVRASQDAAYVELGSGRWLCAWPDAVPQCFALPARLPAVAEAALQQGEGYLILAEPGAEHSLKAKVHAGALRLEHTRSWPARDPAAPVDCADVPPPERDRRDRPQRALWPRALKSRIAATAPADVPGLVAVLHASAQRGREAGNDVRLESFRRGEHALTLVSEWGFGEEISQQWLCVRRAGEPARCRPSRGYRDPVVLAAERTLPRGWLLLADAGGGRASESVALWLDLEARGAELPLAEQGGVGEDCGELGRGYCMWIEGTCTPFELVAPDCVRLGASIAWSAVHLREERRWQQRKREPASTASGPAAGSYRPTAEGWVAADCAAPP